MQLTKDDFPLRAEGPLIYARTRSSSILTAWDDELALTVATMLNNLEARRQSLRELATVRGALPLTDAMTVLDGPEIVAFGPFGLERGGPIDRVISVTADSKPVPFIEGTIRRDPETGRSHVVVEAHAPPANCSTVSVGYDGAASFPEGRL